MKHISLFVLATALAVPAVSNAQSVPPLKKGESYATVRIKMLKAGWEPYHAPDAEPCMDGDLRCQGRPEMESCAGTGLANCKFLWKKQQKIVGICTVGESNNKFSNMCND